MIKHTHGFTLLEVLVAILVLSLGLLGLAALQVTSLSFNTDSYSRTQATLAAYDIIDKMRANPTGVTSGDYDVDTVSDAATKQSSYASCSGTASSGGACNCTSAGPSCTPSNLALHDLGKWYEKLAAKETLLPGANDPARYATITRDSTNLVRITINWKERDVDQSHQWQVQM